MVCSGAGPGGGGLCARGGHDSMAVGLLDASGISLPSTASAHLTPKWWRKPNVRMDPTLRIDRRDR